MDSTYRERAMNKLNDVIKDTLSILKQEEKKEEDKYIVDKYTTPVYIEIKEEDDSLCIHVYSDINPKGSSVRVSYYDYSSLELRRELKGDILKLGLETKEQKERQEKLLKEMNAISGIISAEKLNWFNVYEDLTDLSNTIETITKNRERLYKEYPEMKEFDSSGGFMYSTYLSTEPLEGTLHSIKVRAEELIEQLHEEEKKYE